MDMPFGRDECFLCGTVLTVENRSNEHFLPRWFPRAATESLRISLVNQSISLANQLIVPCCVDCNGTFSAVEQRLATAMRKGPAAVLALDRRETAAWAAKVIWGFAVLEARLPEDRAKPTGPRILTAEQANWFRPLQQIAQNWLSGASTQTGSLHTFHSQHASGVNGQVEVPGFGQVEVPTLCGVDH